MTARGPGLQPVAPHHHRRGLAPRRPFSRAVEAVGIMPKTKGKIPRINFEAGEPIAFSDENWETIEEAYGHPISGEVRT